MAQEHWVVCRDDVGLMLDRARVTAHGMPELRLALALVEDSLRQGDRAMGLLS